MKDNNQKRGNHNKQDIRKQDVQGFATAPYNFIPFEEFAIARYKMNELPVHNKFYSITNNSDGEEQRFTGKITYDLKTLTELFVGGEEERQNDERVKTRLFFQDNKNYIIPGSSIRGHVRSNAEILSLSKPEFIEDSRFMFRTFADKSQEMRKEYTKYLRCMNERGEKKSFHKSVKAGYFFWETKDKLCYIPAPDFGDTGLNYVKVHETDLRKYKILLNQNQYMYREPIIKLGTYYKQKGDNLTDKEREQYKKEYFAIISKKRNPNYEPYGNKPFSGNLVSFNYVDGKLCDLGNGKFKGNVFNSAYIRDKTFHYLINYYTLKELNERTDVYEVPLHLIIDFEKDLESNKQMNEDIKRTFYNFPYDANGKRLVGRKHAKLFFYGLDESGKLFGFGATPYFRIFYNNEVTAGLEKKPLYYKGKEIDKQEREKYVDFVEAIFGFAGDSEKSEHYEGRVCFTNCLLEKEKGKLDKKRTLIPGQPKASAIQMYLSQKDKDIKTLNHYNSTGNKLEIRGRKFYWKRERAFAGISEVNNIKIASAFQPLKSNHIFSGTVWFKNLASDELGLLISSLQLNESDTENIGYAKPYGYGKIKIENMKLHITDKTVSFLNLDSNSATKSGNIEDYKKEFVAYMDKSIPKTIMKEYSELDSIKIYKRLREDYSFQEEDISYMDVDGYKKRKILPTVQVLMKKLDNRGDIDLEALKSLGWMRK